MKKYGLIIDGVEVDSADGKTFRTVNPATGEELAEVAEAGPADIDRAVESARKAFESGPWRKMTATERGKLLSKVADLCFSHREDLAMTDTLDSGKPLNDTRNVDIPMGAEFIEYYAGMCDKILGNTYPVGQMMHNYSVRAPYGVTGLITPWNYPFLIEAYTVAPAIAAGNTCVLKAPELTPMSAVEFGRICLEAGIPAGVVNVVPGLGPVAGEHLASHPDVNVIAYTGGTEVGRRILTLAAPTMKRVILECGGKSANIVFPDADLEAAAYYAAFGVFINSGQECVASSRLFLHESIHDAFVDRLVGITEGIKVGDPLEEDTVIGSMASKKQYDKVLRYIKMGKETATLMSGGCALTDGKFARGFFVRPTIFTDVTNDMPIAREEIFGPVLSVMRWKDEEEVIRTANDTPYGLAGAVWTNDIARGHLVAQRIDAGNVWVNATCQFHWCAPFGGYKYSGLGSLMGPGAIEGFTQVKNIWINLSHESFRWAEKGWEQ